MPCIEALDVYRVAMPLIYPFRTAFGNDATIESVLVRMEAGGVCGWGEASPWKFPAYCPESAAGVFLTITDFMAPALAHRDITSGELLQQTLAVFKGNNFAKAALDLAWWDVHAKIRGEPLWKTIGGQRRQVEVGEDFGIMDNIPMLLDAIRGAVGAGFRRVKLKYRPGWEINMLEAVRNSFPDIVIHIDCNSAYTLADTAMFKELDRFKLAMIEQPLMHDDLIDHAELQKRIDTPICLDESITSPDKARKAVQVGACRWVNIKPGRVGGITNAIRIHDICMDAGIPCWLGGMLESAVGASHCLALASLPNIRYPSDIFATSRFYREDLSEPAMELSGPSVMDARMAPGAGAQPHPERLAALSLDHARIAP